MKERQILFSGEMVRAILDGRKSVTRRVCKFNAAGRLKMPGSPKNWHRDDPDAVKACPYGQPGDRLYVKEKWGCDCHNGLTPRPLCEIVYPDTAVDDPPLSGWKSGRFMPKWASRITLEVTGVRVERVQEITEDDALKEGVLPSADIAGWDSFVITRPGAVSYRKSFAQLWGSLNAKRGFGWDKNPWVWVVEFKRVTP